MGFLVFVLVRILQQNKDKGVMMLSEKEIISLFGEFALSKCKSFSQNSIRDKGMVNALLQRKNDFKSLKEIDIFLRKLRNLGLLSVLEVQWGLKMIMKFIEKNGSFNPNMEEKDYIEFFFSFKNELSTIRNYKVGLDLFLKFLLHKKYKTIDYSKIKINFLKEKKLPRFLNEDKYNLFLNEIKKIKETNIFKIREKLMILFACYTGMRTREIRNITLSDIIEENEFFSIRVKGKGNIERLVSIKKDLIGDLLKKFLKEKKRKNKNSIYLFQLVNKNTPPTLTSISIKGFLKKIDSVKERGNSLHLLRHSFASFVYKKSKDILLTQKILGHSSINTTQIYIHLDTDLNEKVANYF